MTVFSTRISCFDATWNPTFGCDHVSPGCDNCYAETIANRFHGGFALRLKPHRLRDAGRFKPIDLPEGPRPPIVFVNSMSDLWHPDVPDAYLDRVFDAVEGNPRAVFVCLTKRAPRMARYCADRWGGRGHPRPCVAGGERRERGAGWPPRQSTAVATGCGAVHRAGMP